MLLRVVMVALAIALAPAAAPAQGTQIALGLSDHDRSQPVEVTAETLRVDQGAGTAQFLGDVLVQQGALRLSARQVTVIYGPAQEDAPRRIARLEAEGDVLMTLQAEAAEADRAVYTVDDAQVVMTGNVLLTQGDGAVAGQRLVADLARGTGTMEGRVRTVLQPATGAQ
ncbi:LptA/OstA family protein [Rhodovulum adriaticum]|uniref:Lipopolysaccharide export system protein LptA n=1 Tax=Rhodovulum adriaticum TaxID=35804 RepID=A0A4R2NYK4_RHOAD|nr:LptA/OstA family protein [Rhodovulum adriaticum]TCP27363.1 lipopolysaccharide export system protein LptA [Rhodovulum adriaticum]